MSGLLLAAGAAVAAPVAPSAEDPTRELIERERIRATILGALERSMSRFEERRALTEDSEAAVAEMAALGQPAVEFLTALIDTRTVGQFRLPAFALGRIGGPEAEQALERAIAAADLAGGKFARLCKAWAVGALATAGRSDAVTLLDGKTLASRVDYAAEFTAMEMVAMRTAETSGPLLRGMLERYESDERLVGRLHLILSALRHLEDPPSRQVALRYLDHERSKVRHEAVRLLAVHAQDQDDDWKRLLAALDDDAPRVRYTAAKELAMLEPPQAVAALRARLETETSSPIRGSLLEALGGILGPEALPLFREELRRPDPSDRMWALRALDTMDHVPIRRNLILAALEDPAETVQSTAAYVLARLGDRASRDGLLLSMNARTAPLLFAAARTLAELGEPRAGARVAGRLLQVDLARFTGQSALRSSIRVLSGALVDLGFTDVIDDLTKVTARLTDPPMKRHLEGVLDKLRRIRELREAPERWEATLAEADHETRELLHGVLARQGDEAALRLLVRAYGFADHDEERVKIFQLLARSGTPLAAPLVTRILEDSSLDGFSRIVLRSEAAWLARRIGGEAMRDLLRRYVLRTVGHDYPAVVYYAVLAGPDALDVLEQIRFRRMFAVPSHHRGLEQDRIEWMLQRLERDLSIGKLDRPPRTLKFPG